MGLCVKMSLSRPAGRDKLKNIKFIPLIMAERSGAIFQSSLFTQAKISKICNLCLQSIVFTMQILYTGIIHRRFCLSKCVSKRKHCFPIQPRKRYFIMNEAVTKRFLLYFHRSFFHEPLRPVQDSVSEGSFPYQYEAHICRAL